MDVNAKQNSNIVRIYEDCILTAYFKHDNVKSNFKQLIKITVFLYQSYKSQFYYANKKWWVKVTP